MFPYLANRYDLAPQIIILNACKYLNYGYYRYNPHKEFERMGIPNDTWRITTV